MTPEQLSTMQTDIATIKTLLTQLVGANGNNGRFGNLEAKVDEHEAYIQRQTGGGRVLQFVWTGIVSIVAGYFGGKTH